MVTLSRRPVPDRQSAWFRVRCHLPPGLLQEHLRTLFDFSSFEHSTGALAGRSWQEPPGHGRLGMALAPSQVLQEQSRTLFIFSPSIQERAAERRWRGPSVQGSGMAPGSQTVARTFAYLIQFFVFAGLLGRVASSQAAPNASVVVTFGMVRGLLRAVFLRRLVQVLSDHGFGR